MIEPQYFFAGGFHQGLARVETKPLQFGYVNRQGTIVIPAVYSEARDFSEGLAEVATAEKRFYIKTDGTVAFEVGSPGQSAEAGADKGTEAVRNDFANNPHAHHQPQVLPGDRRRTVRGQP